MTYKRLLTSLASHPPSSSATTSRLIPPYAQTLPSFSQTPSSSLRPPYTHTVPLNVEAKSGSSRSLKSSKKFELILKPSSESGSRQRQFSEWRKEILSNEQIRRDITSRWNEVLINLERLKDGHHQIPQITFQQLSSELSTAATVDNIKATGLVVVRDVVRDSEAIEWARDILLSMGERNGRAVYWHPALLAARSNPSILSANSQVSQAILSSPDVYVTASSIIEGLHPSPTTPQSSNPWETPRSLLSNLTLTPSIPTASTVVSPTILAAEYSALRPLFRSIRSKISFYSNSDSAYLDPANWELNDSSSLAQQGEGGQQVDLPHLKQIQIVHPELTPGDMVFHHSSLPISTSPSSGQVFLPLNPILKNELGSEVFIQQQKEAFEHGLPPPNELESNNEELWQVEGKGDKSLIGSRAGREAMGY